MAVAPSPSGPATERPALSTLISKLCCDASLFALGISIARVVELASSDDQGTQSLSYYVLADVALTQKILRIANTPTYRTANGGAVTTISRAIALLGFDNVKVTALAMLLVDTLANSKQADSVRAELEIALCASLVGREMARLSPYQGAEEVAIASLFKNIAPLLIASQEHERFRNIGALVAGGMTAGQAAQEVLGCSYDTLSAAVLREWKIPDVIVRSLSTLPPGPQKHAQNRAEWMRQVTSFSIATAQMLFRDGAPAGSAEALALQRRYGEALGIGAEQLNTIFQTVRTEMADLLVGMNWQPREAAASAAGPASGAGLPEELRGAAMQSAAASDTYPSGKPANASALLLAGLQQAVLLRAGGPAKVNELIMVVLETLCRGMGFRFATICLKDPRTGAYRARLAYGEARVERQTGFVFPMQAEQDLFHLAMANNADLMIADARVEKIRQLLPPWHRTLLPDTRSLIVLPLVLQGAPLGLFYADRAQCAPEGVPPDETALIRALKEQVQQALSR